MNYLTLASPLDTYRMVPTYHPDSKLWFYGNVRLLRGNLATVPRAICRYDLERAAEKLVLDGFTIVTGIHNDLERLKAIVPLRWGAPRILVLSGGIRFHLGPRLSEEPFRAAKLWRYQWDPKVDLAISRRAPDRLPTFATHNPTIDRLISEVACKLKAGLYPSPTEHL